MIEIIEKQRNMQISASILTDVSSNFKLKVLVKTRRKKLQREFQRNRKPRKLLVATQISGENIILT